MKQDSLIVFVIGAVLTLVISNLVIYVFFPSGDRAADGVGVSIFIIIIWFYPWFVARRKQKKSAG
jgi:hypothetical protein